MNKYENLSEIMKSSEEVYSGRLLHVFKDYVTLPNGRESTREYIKHVGAVAIVPITDDGRVAVERQFRYPLNQVITEIPAGKLDSKEEDRLEAAKRELVEETGISADEWVNMGDFHPTCAYSDEVITLYLAKGLNFGEQKLDNDEFLNVEFVPLKDLVKEVLEGKITDGKTQTAILKAAAITGVFPMDFNTSL